MAIRVVALLAVLLAFGSHPARAGTAQQHVHEMSHSVMPFNISKVIHIFQMTEAGGIQSVVIRDPAYKDQIPLIQEHLQAEARNFEKGNYTDPAKLHGTNMPGLKELTEGSSRVRVSYTALATGGEIKFETNDPHLLTAIHRWFGAQLSEQGADARAE